MPDFQRLYRDAFAVLGHTLKPEDALPDDVISEAEHALNVRLPEALRDYFRVAGRETRLNRAFQRLLRPEEWFVDDGRLAFMEENQVSVFWGIEASGEAFSVPDPPVFQGINAEPRLEWYREHDACSVFLLVMLHFQATFGGGMKFGAAATAPPGTMPGALSDWHFVGEINGMRAYSRPGQALCWMLSEEGSGNGDGDIFAGAASEAALDDLLATIPLDWQC